VTNKIGGKKIYSVDEFIKQHLRHGQHHRKRIIDMKAAIWQKLERDMTLCDSNNCYQFSKDSEFKVFETTNFGWIVFHPDSRTPEGAIPGRRIFKW